MTSKCKKHFIFPDIENCKECISGYELILERWYGKKAIENFRHNYQREVLLVAMRNL